MKDLLVVKQSNSLNKNCYESIVQLAEKLADFKIHSHIVVPEKKGEYMDTILDMVNPVSVYTFDDLDDYLRGYGIPEDILASLRGYPRVYRVILIHLLNSQQFSYGILCEDNVVIKTISEELLDYINNEKPFTIVNLGYPFSDKILFHKICDIFSSDLTKYYLESNNRGLGLTANFAGIRLDIMDKFPDEVSIKALLRIFDYSGIIRDHGLDMDRQEWDATAQYFQDQSLICVLSAVLSDLNLLDINDYAYSDSAIDSELSGVFIRMDHDNSEQ